MDVVLGGVASVGLFGLRVILPGRLRKSRTQ